jgi:phage gp46-like protein
MRDVLLSLIDSLFDISLLNDDLASDDGLETAVAISFFTDRRVSVEDLPYGQQDRKGWWGDMFPDVDQDKIGSRMWTLLPAKVTDETRNLANDYAAECLQWMIDDGIASSIKIDSEYNGEKHLTTSVEIVKPTGESEKFSVFWESQKVRRL